MKSRLYILVFIFLSVLLPVETSATHNRAGEIRCKQIAELTYEITIITYTYSLSAADREELEVSWGDDTYSIAPRVEKVMLPDYYQRNKYVSVHTFPGPGAYRILVQDPNRNYGVNNIPNSVNTVFSISTTIYIIPDLGTNTTPVLLNPPINLAGYHKFFIHNPGAYDAEGDSLAYRLTDCLGEDGEPIEGYTLPPTTDELYIDEYTGDFIWNTPADTGKYNVAFAIEEWRSGIKIGEMIQDMQIDVHETDNNPPVNVVPDDICVLAGDTVDLVVYSEDVDGDSIELTMAGGPLIFEEDSAVYEVTESQPGLAIANLRWATTCSHIRKRPYDIVLTAKDDNSDIKLVDMDHFSIKVMGPPVTDIEVTKVSATLSLDWRTPSCKVKSYHIYRRNKSNDIEPDSCQTGIPPSWGYELIGETEDTTFFDNNDGEGLYQGFEYCYRIVVEYEDGSLSPPSHEICAVLERGIPLITNVSVRHTDIQFGSILVKWMKPLSLDTISNANGPFVYFLYRSDGIWAEDLDPLDTLAYEDTSYVDTLFNTLDMGYSYSVALVNFEPGNQFRVGNPQIASSPYLETTGSDRMIDFKINRNTPWINYRYDYYLQNDDGTWSLQGSSTEREWRITGLDNDKKYCYRVVTRGYYMLDDSTEVENSNFSQVTCEVPVDSVPPCRPSLSVTSNCDSMFNHLVWSLKSDSCTVDIDHFLILYAMDVESPLDTLVVLPDAELREYYHFPKDEMGICYQVIAVDGAGNESLPSVKICTDACSDYRLPNVFTPNGDGMNDIYYAYNPGEVVKMVDMKIYNRWGDLVYETTNPEIAWDGKLLNSDRVASTGVYYYICTIYEERISGTEERAITGFIQLIAETGSSTIND